MINLKNQPGENAKRFISGVFLTFIFAHCSFSIAATPSQQLEMFHLTTSDGKASINGEIDYPDSSENKLTTIILVGGTHLFDRDYKYGNSKTDKDLLFLTLKNIFTEQGYAVVRFDYRGVSCNVRTAPLCEDCKTEKQKMVHFVKACINNTIRQSVTETSKASDLALLYNYITRHNRLNPKKIIILAHSEGTLHTARLIERSEIAPKGLIFIGSIIDSPKNTIAWQWVSRLTDNFFKMVEHDFPEKISNAEIDFYCEKQGVIACENLRSPQGFWTKKSLSQYYLTTIYPFFRQQTLTYKADAPFKHVWGQYGAIFSSYSWWQQFFTDDRRVIDRLDKYAGRIAFHQGGIDGAIPPDSVSELKKYAAKHNNRRLHFYPELGHALGKHSMVGPIEKVALKNIINDVKWILEQNN